MEWGSPPDADRGTFSVRRKNTQMQACKFVEYHYL